jgi:hypothetical protein
MQPIKWEYHTVTLDVEGIFNIRVDGGQLTEEFNLLGRAGWELVSMFDLNRGHGRSSSVVAVFKRVA